jgi:ribonuclease HII
MKKSKFKYIIGIDEVGRGPLAGPVVVAAVALSQSRINRKLNSRIFANKNSRTIRDLPLRDSKKLSPKQREIWFEYIKKHPKIFYAVAKISPQKIDKINISKAANLAATNAFKRLIKNSGLKIKNCKIFLDGGLYLNIKMLLAIGYWLKPKTVIKGDEKIPAIMLASIIAKIHRDRLMKKFHKKYPKYGFDRHKGYGTKDHFKAVKANGFSKIHRLTFLKKIS